MSTADVTQLKESVDEIKEILIELGKRQEQQTQLLIGNPLNKDDEGILGRLKAGDKRHDEMQTKLEEIVEARKKSKWFVAGAVFVGSIVFGIVQVAIKLIIK